MESVGWRADQHRAAEVLHYLDLALCIASGNWDHSRADSLSAVMNSQAAGEHAVTVGVLDDVSLACPSTGDGPGHDFGPDVYVVARIPDYLGLSGRAG